MCDHSLHVPLYQHPRVKSGPIAVCAVYQVVQQALRQKSPLRIRLQNIIN